MRRSFFIRLAVGNIRRNRRTYLPYLLASSLTVMMFYILVSLGMHSGLAQVSGGDSLRIILGFGGWVVALFSLIFLFYTNSFLIKRRKKELALFNVLGMEKKHLARILFWETLFTALICLIAGLGAGVLFYKLMLLILFKIMGIPAPFGFELSLPALALTALLFGAIFFLVLLNNLRQVHLARPIELLKAGSAGEQEPRTRWLLMLLGLVTLGAGYYLALSIEHPIVALQMFFFAVILVIIGTYLLFTAGSIGVLKLFRRSKRFYYRPNNFIAVSGMLYRMKQNAVGLANIAILSTMVLVTLSTTISLYLGVEDALKTRYPHDLIVTTMDGKAAPEEVRETVLQVLEEQGYTPQSVLDYRTLVTSAARAGETFIPARAWDASVEDVQLLYVLPIEDYNRESGRDVKLASDELLVYSPGAPLDYPTLNIYGRTFKVRQLDSFFTQIVDPLSVLNSHYLVVSDLRTLQHYASSYGADVPSIDHYLGVDLEAERDELIELHAALKKALPASRVQSAAVERDEFYSLYGGLLFIGIFLGSLFLMAAVLIIYYKQITEGYEDQRRYRIMQQVGMGRQEVRRSVHRQVLMVFFLPLVTAGVHILFAFKMITKLLQIFELTNIRLFVLCSLGTFALFALFYALVYRATAGVYYKIVGEAALGG